MLSLYYNVRDYENMEWKMKGSILKIQRDLALILILPNTIEYQTNGISYLSLQSHKIFVWNGFS